MARFTDLPNEIIREILGLIQPEDLENFASTCKQISLISGPSLQKHRKLTRRYGTLSNRGPEEEMRTEYHLRTIPTVLKNILDNPRVGRYVKKLHVGALHDNHVEDDDSIEPEEDFGAKYNMLAKAACQVDCLDTLHRTECDWESYIDEGDEEFLLALLLTVLPNLNTLSIKWVGEEYSWLRRPIERVFTAANPNLSNLRIVHLEPRTGQHIDFEDLPLFSALPSLKSLSAQRVCDEEDWENNLLSRQQSNATHLIMPRSTVSGKLLHEYLLSFPLLQTFEYEHAVPDVGEEYKPFDPFLLRSALLSQAKTTLQNLSITGPLSQQSFMGPLRGFEVLREVHTNWSFLIPPLVDISSWPSGMLPASLRTLKVRDRSGRDPKQYAELVKGLTSAKVLRRTCPLLEAFELAAPRVLEAQDLQRRCEKVGITFVFRSDPSCGEI